VADATTVKRRVLVVDDEEGVRESLRMTLKDDYETIAVGSAEEALDTLTSASVDVVLLDILMPGMDGMKLLEELRARNLNMPIIMLTATKTLKTAIEAMKLGAFWYVTKPFDVDELRLHLQRATENADLKGELQKLRSEVRHRYHVGNIIGHSPKMEEVFKTVETVAKLRTTILITGESGTGKELIAKAIHYGSPRAHRPLVTLNCAAIPETLLESELFGHEKGSFTDAHTKKLGQFELAHEGSLFLDEIGEMGGATQAKLLRVLEHGEFLRVGGMKPVCVDVRIIAATNRDLAVAMKENKFRTDLFYRLNVVSVHLPPLRERRDDMSHLIRHFTQAKAREMGMAEKTFSPEAVDALLRYPWPGNVRELENLIERLLVLTEGTVITLEDLPEQVRRTDHEPGNIKEAVLEGRKSLGTAVDEFEREIIDEALQKTDFNQTRAAELLGTTRRILKYRMDKLGIIAPER